MASTTPKRGLPYPGNADVPDIAGDFADLATAVDTKLGSAGKSIIATTESRTNTAYGFLTTHDVVTGIVLPTDGLIFLAYQATWQESVAGAARAAIFVGANQLKVQGSNTGTAVVTAAMSGGTTGRDRPLLSAPGVGLFSSSRTVGSGSADVTTGQALGIMAGNLATTEQLTADINGVAGVIPNVDVAGAALGGAVPIFAAAGTYDIAVMFKSSSGSVTAKNRKLWVWVETF